MLNVDYDRGFHHKLSIKTYCDRVNIGDAKHANTEPWKSWLSEQVLVLNMENKFNTPICR